MPGNGTVSSSSGYPGGVAAQIVVCRYDPSKDDDFFTPIPNLECLGIQSTEGANPGVARFRYRFGATINPAWPTRVEQVVGLGVPKSPFVPAIDQRIAVVKIDPSDDSDVEYTTLFDGTVQVPQWDVSGEEESVTFQAVGIAARLWETPVGGATFRNGPDIEDQKDAYTNQPARFNPDGLPNATARKYWTGNKDGGDDGGDDEDSDTAHPVFIDPPNDGLRDKKYMELWTLSSAVMYLLAVYNLDELYVHNPKFSTLAAILDSFEVVGDVYDPADPSTYTENVITVEDYDATGYPWPVAIEKIITPHGFAFRFKLDEGASGQPNTTMEFYRTDAKDDVDPKWVYLDRAGSSYVPAASNAAGISAGRDVAGLYNWVILDTELIRQEVSLVLAPGFTPAEADLGTIENFTVGNPAFVGDARDAYRVFVFNEDGAGYYDKEDAEFKEDLIVGNNLDDVFGKPRATREHEEIFAGNGPAPRYVARPRKPIGTLFSRRTVDGDRLRAQLHVSVNYKTKTPGVWDGSGDWQLVSDSVWELLPNRIGVRFTGENPNKIQIGKPPAGTPNRASDGAGSLRLIQCLAKPTPPWKWCYFRLTCVIESDRSIDARAVKRPSSTSPRIIQRRVDTRDRFVQHVIEKSSYLNTTGFDILDQDDTDDAKAYAEALRMSHEAAPIQGTVTIPRLTLAYEIGDPIRGIFGRNVDFRINQGAPAGEAAMYPVISSIDWDFSQGERTVLHLTTRQYDPPPERRR